MADRVLEIRRGWSAAAGLGDSRRTASASLNLSAITTPEADAQIRTIDDWWRENRRASRNLFLNELTGAFEIIAGARIPVVHIGARPSLAHDAFC